MNHKRTTYIRLLSCWVGVLLFGFLGLAFPGHALDTGVEQAIERQTIADRISLTSIQDALAIPTITAQMLVDRRTDLEKIQLNAKQQAQNLEEPMREISERIERLGPAPAKDVVEAPELVAQRKQLSDQFNKLQGIRAQLSIIATEAEQASARAAAMQRDLFLKWVFQPSRSILNPYLWGDAFTGFTTLNFRLWQLVLRWADDTKLLATPFKLLIFPLIVILGFVLWKVGVHRLNVNFGGKLKQKKNPNDLDRLWIIIRTLIGVLVFSFIFSFGFLFLIQETSLETPRFMMIVDVFLGFIMQTMFSFALVYRLAARQQPAWRILNLDDKAANRFLILGMTASLISALATANEELARAVFISVPASNGMSAVFTLAMLITCIMLLLNFTRQPGLPEEYSKKMILFPRADIAIIPTRLMVFVATAALLLGYIALSEFVIFRIFLMAGVVLVFYIIHCLVDVGTQSLGDPASLLGKLVRQLTHLGDRGIDRLALLIRTLVDVVLAMMIVPILFYLWSVTWVDFRGVLYRLSVGFMIGDVKISPWSILVGIMVFLVGVILTRLFVRWLNRRVLAETHINEGVQNSVSTGITYAGYLIAGGIAVSAGGIDLSSLAIVAGALSVGIGFGLQAITSNFISGLILLAERPIRVGDWVIVTKGEGIIKKINVRSTEIETFDGCSIIVPNSSLITDAVRNWTHRNTMGRIGFEVITVYGADVARVKEILTEVVKKNSRILNYPEPTVMLDNFLPTGNQFSVKGHVANIAEGGGIASDLRLAISAALKENGIEFGKT